ncbi:MAG: hypothetical protein ACXABY_11630 [Candidatus Thorarchaeota archaeon]|jgi:hypothetical protein
MTLDWIGFINTNANLTPEQKTALLDDFCEAYDYQDILEDGEPNPVIKKDFANAWIERFLQNTVNRVRRQRAEDAVTIEELQL